MTNSINSGKAAQRDISLDIAKGICIMLMVIAHAGCPGWLSHFIYLFHMPCFFFISGMLLSERYIDDPKAGILKKLKGYYKPFIKWELIFLLLHNVFVALYVIDGETFSWQVTLKRALGTVFMTRGEQLLGGYWFLISLTWASIGSIVILSLMKRRKLLTSRIIVGGGYVIIVALAIASTEHLLPIGLPQQFRCQTFLALAFFVSGYVYKEMMRTNKIPQFLTGNVRLLLLLAVLVVSFCWQSSMSDAKGLSVAYYAVALCGTLGFLQLSKILQHRWIIATFNYIGNKTLYVLTFHFLALKLVSLAWIGWHGLPIERLAEFPVMSGTNSWLWVPYTLVGVVVPLLIWEAKEAVLQRFRRKS